MSKVIHNFLTDPAPVVSFNINQGSPLSSPEELITNDLPTQKVDVRMSGKGNQPLVDPVSKIYVPQDPAYRTSLEFQESEPARQTSKIERSLKAPKKLRGLAKEFAPSDSGLPVTKNDINTKERYADPISLPPKDGVNKRTRKSMKNKKGPPVKIFKLSGESEACIEIGKDFVRIKAGDGSFIIINKSSINAGSTNMNWQMSPEQITYHGLLNQINPIAGMFPISPKYFITPGPIIALANAFKTNAMIANAVGIVV